MSENGGRDKFESGGGMNLKVMDWNGGWHKFKNNRRDKFENGGWEHF